MERFVTILLGSAMGGRLYIYLVYNEANIAPDDRFFSYSDTQGMFFAVAIVTSFIFLGFFYFFRVKNESYLQLTLAAFMTQLIVLTTIQYSQVDLGVLGLGIAIFVFSALANFILDKIAKPKD